MALVINSNVSSLNAQRQLVKSGGEMAQAMERLSSGKRINTAADDAAGLAITNRQTSQIKGLDRAVANANDGISLIQTAEGALDETTNILQRMRELSIQSANGIYEDKDRATLDAEVQQLKAEIDRIAETTTFNGKNLFDGSAGKLDLQIGSQSNQTVSVEIGKMDTKSLGGVATGDLVGAALASNDLLAGLQAVTGGSAAAAANISMSINSQNVGDLSGATSLNEALDTINKNISGVEVSAFTEMTAAEKGTGIIRGAASLDISLSNADGSTTTFQIKDTGSMNELVDKINSVAKGQLEAGLNEDGKLTLASKTGAHIEVTADGTDDVAGSTAAGFTATGAEQGAQLSFTITDKNIDNVNVSYTGTAADGTTALTAAAAASAGSAATGVQTRVDGDITGAVVSATAVNLVEGDLTINGVAIGAATGVATAPLQADAMVEAINKKSAETGVVASRDTAGAITLNSVDGSEISIELKGNAASATGLLETNNSKTFGNSVANIDISTQAGAQKAIDTIDTALEQINSSRADMGAMTNRLEFTVSNLMNVSENTSAARSRIQDADFAAETANLSRAQVLQQASQAMLAQANAAPQQVLSLLR